MGNKINELSSKEKSRLERFSRDLKNGPLDFMGRQKVRIILTLLGSEQPRNKVLQANAVGILKDDQPFKERRLRKLINGRGPQ